MIVSSITNFTKRKEFNNKNGPLTSTQNKSESSAKIKKGCLVGDFDLFHSGHVDLMEQFKKENKLDYLCLALPSDKTLESVQGRYPILNLHERLLSVLSSKVHFFSKF